MKGAFNRCLVSIAVVFSFFAIGLFQLLDLVPSDLYSFVFGSVLYALPCVIAFSSPYTPKRALMALCCALLMLLEFIAAYLWVINSYAIVGVFYRPAALALYLLMAIACLWGSNGRLNKRNGGYNFRHKRFIGNGQATNMVFKKGAK